MKKKIIIKILAALGAFVILILLLATIFVDPWIEKIIRTTLNEKNSKYHVHFNNAHISIFTSGLELNTISIRTKQEYKSKDDLNVEIASFKCNGINIINVFYKNEIDIHDITISNVSGTIPLSHDSIQPMILSMNILIGKIFFNKINLAIKDFSSSKEYAVKEGFLKIYNFSALKKDTLSHESIKQFDFEAKELLSVASDCMYINTVNGFKYSSTSNTLEIDSYSIHPKYKGYAFTSRHKFQTDCVEAELSNIYVHDFSIVRFLKLGSLVSSYTEIGNIDINVFRDRRKESSHSKVPMFQDIIYNCPNYINIDSIGLENGKVIYTEHAEKANHPGTITFNKINAKIYRITNDTIFKKEKAFFEIKSNALVMGKGKMTVVLKSQLFSSDNSFSLNGTLSAMEARELNPMVERNAFLYIVSGRIDDMNFTFTANNNKSTGKMTLLYHGLNVAIKNKETDDTSAIKEKIVSLITNMKMMNSNPLPRKDVRVGIIDFERNHEASPFNYCFKSILSGIKSSITKNPTKKSRSNSKPLNTNAKALK